MKVMLTGCAGFIGFHLAKKLIENNYHVIGLDSLNNYYSTKIKKDRLKILFSSKKRKFKFYKIKLENKNRLKQIFLKNKIDIVINLAAQAGVRYSLINPEQYLKSNIVGFFNLIDLSKSYKIKHFIYASTSSIYGDEKKMPLKENFPCNDPLQFYAATKKSNEMIAKSYSNLFKLKSTGLRFFTVYGPWGRPDMALFKFTSSILQKKPIEIFNYGNHKRDFTYIDDIVQGIFNIVKNKNRINKIYEIVNLGNGKPISLMKYVRLIEKELKISAKKKFVKKQKGDVVKTHSDIKYAKKNYNFSPKTAPEQGVKKFIKWYKNYYKIS